MKNKEISQTLLNTSIGMILYKLINNENICMYNMLLFIYSFLLESCFEKKYNYLFLMGSLFLAQSMYSMSDYFLNT